MSDTIDHSLDASGLNCPLPILKTKKALNTLDPGKVIEVLATDPGSKPDFEAFCRQTGHTMLTQSEVDGVFRFLIRKN